MSALARLFGRLRGGLVEAGDALVGSQAQRILDVEIRRADERLHALRTELAALKVQRLGLSDDLLATQDAIDRREAQAMKALASGEMPIAHELAAVIAALEQQRQCEHDALQRIDARIEQLRLDIEMWSNTLRRLKHQLDTMRASEGVQLAQATVASRQPAAAGLPRTALEAVQRMKARERARTRHDGRASVGADPGDPLDTRLQAAGIIAPNPQAAAVIARLQKQGAPAARTAPKRRSARTAKDGLDD